MDLFFISNSLFVKDIGGGGGAPLLLFDLIFIQKIIDIFSISNPIFFRGGGRQYYYLGGRTTGKREENNGSIFHF